LTVETIRSLLFVPGDSEKKIARALSSQADAIILDLEDSILPDRRPAARGLCLETLKAGSNKKLLVRINALDANDALLDLSAVTPGRPFGIMLPKCGSAGELLDLDRYLTALEVRDGVPNGFINVVAIITETAGSLFQMGSYRAGTQRLAGLLWGGEDLAADIGAKANRDPEGRYTAPYELARTLALLAATTSRVAAIDAVYTNFRDPDGLRQEAQKAARDGFTAKAAIHPDQIEIINEVFSPTSEEIAHAQRVVALFEDQEGLGTTAMDGRMLDRPHLVMAKRLLSRTGLCR
jgi:citrate lyase subunit beta/citryl-CoA lyase